jgi:hypothetical protein
MAGQGTKAHLIRRLLLAGWAEKHPAAMPLTAGHLAWQVHGSQGRDLVDEVSAYTDPTCGASPSGTTR